jgi:hypothetical protein
MSSNKIKQLQNEIKKLDSKEIKELYLWLKTDFKPKKKMGRPSGKKTNKAKYRVEMTEEDGTIKIF